MFSHVKKPRSAVGRGACWEALWCMEELGTSEERDEAHVSMKKGIGEARVRSVARACRGFQGKIPLSDPKLHIWITSTAKESYGSTHQLPGSKSPCSEDTILCSEPSAECKFVPSSNSQVSINRGNTRSEKANSYSSP